MILIYIVSEFIFQTSEIIDFLYILKKMLQFKDFIKNFRIRSFYPLNQIFLWICVVLYVLTNHM